MEKKSFVLTGYTQRSTCDCGCVTSNCFFLDGGFGGSAHLASLHQGIEKYLDELSGAGPGRNGDACDIKVTITIEPLGEHEHRILNRHSFTGLGCEDNEDLKAKITTPTTPENEMMLKGEDEFGESKKHAREIDVCYLQDIHDRLLLLEQSPAATIVCRLADLRKSLQHIIESG